MLTYPHINPIAVSIGPIFGLGPLRVHWYGIMYLIGFIAAWWLARYRSRRPGSTWSSLDIDDLIFYCALGVIAGGRLGWCIFYGHDVIAENWLNVFHIWDGGMSFHGGMTGVLVATIVFGRVKHKAVAERSADAVRRDEHPFRAGAVHDAQAPQLVSERVHERLRLADGCGFRGPRYTNDC